MNEFHREMSKYKERKLGAYRQLECVFYGLEERSDKDKALAADDQLHKVDNVKSEVYLKCAFDYMFVYSATYCFIPDPTLIVNVLMLNVSSNA